MLRIGYNKLMNLKRLLKFGILATIFAGLNLLADRLDLYWILSWYDSMMHTLAGIVIANAVYIVLSWNKSIVQEKQKLLFFTLIFTVIIGLVWEYFEVVFGITYTEVGGYRQDTISDLIYDIFGALIFYYYAINVLVNDRIKK